MNLLRGFVLLLFIGVLAGCQGQPDAGNVGAATGAVTDLVVIGAEAGYPVASNVAGAYPGLLSTDVVMITRTPDPTLDPNAPIPTPMPGMATLTGYIFSSETNQPLVDVPVSLAEIYRNAENQAAFAYDAAFSPMALTDSNGRFTLSNIDPKEYVMVVGSVEVNRYEILMDGSGGGLIFTPQPDVVTDAGTLRVGFEW